MLTIKCRRLALCLGVLGMWLVFAHQAAIAQDWVGDSDQNWDNSDNWAGDVFPGGNAIVNVDAAGVFPIISNTPSFTPVDILVGTGAGNSGRLDHSTGTLSTGAGNWMFVGHEGGIGTYNLTGDGSLNTDAMNIGAWGGNGATGTVNVNTSGTIDLTGGAARPFGFGDASLLVGENNGTGNLNLDNGTINAAFTSRFGQGAIGNLTVNGGELNTTGDTFFGNGGGTGNLTLNDGIVGSTGEIWFGGEGGSSGFGTQNGGTMNSGAWFVVGRGLSGSGDNGNFTLNGGTINAATNVGFAVVASGAGATGTLTINDGTFNAGGGDAVSMIVGEGGNGTLTQGGGMLNVVGDMLIGANDGAVGTYNVSGSAAAVTIGQNLVLGLGAGGTDTTATGTINFIADALGLSTIGVGGDVNLSSDGDFLNVDLAAYAGPYVDLLLIDGATSQGEFTGLAQGSLVATGFAGGDYTIDYSVGGDVWLRAIVVPEPSGVVILAMASLGLSRRKRRI